MPKRRRKRVRLKPGPVLTLALLVALALGMAYSPLTAVSKVAVVGATPAQQRDIESILETLNGIPWLRVNTRWVETRVQRLESVDHARYSQNVFGRGRLEVYPRQPVARIRASRPIGLDASGVLFETDQLPADLPVIDRPPSARELPMCLAGGFASGSLASLVTQLRAMAPQDKLAISFNGEGALCVSMGGGLVILGSSDDLDLKLRALKEILDDQPGILAKHPSLNLTEPSRPTTTYKKPGA